MPEVSPIYRIREVNGHEDEIAETLAELHHFTFFNGARVPKFDHGHWWLAYHEAIPVAFAGVVLSTHAANAGYFCRVGVLSKHRGHDLQLRSPSHDPSISLWRPTANAHACGTTLRSISRRATLVERI